MLPEWLKRPIRPWLDRLVDRVAARVVDRLYPQVEGLLTLHRALDGAPPLPPLRGGAVAPDTFALLVPLLARHPGATVLEFGAGASTQVLARLVAATNGRLVSVEQDADWVRDVQRALEADGTASYVTLVHAPLEEQVVAPSVRPVLTYPAGVLAALPAWDVALVDGPTGFPDAWSRLGPLVHVTERLAQGRAKAALLDDAARSGERDVVALALRPHGPRVAVRWHDTEKGTAVLSAVGG